MHTCKTLPSALQVLDADARIFLYEHFLTDGMAITLAFRLARVLEPIAPGCMEAIHSLIMIKALPLHCVEEADHIVKISEKRLERSGVVSTDGGSEESGIRTSFGVFLERQEDEVIKRVEERIAAWTLMPVG